MRGSEQSGMGEASCLAMCTFFDARAAITFWSSGTGFAGMHSSNCQGLAVHHAGAAAAALRCLCI